MSEPLLMLQVVAFVRSDLVALPEIEELIVSGESTSNAGTTLSIDLISHIETESPDETIPQLLKHFKTIAYKLRRLLVSLGYRRCDYCKDWVRERTEYRYLLLCAACAAVNVAASFNEADAQTQGDQPDGD